MRASGLAALAGLLLVVSACSGVELDAAARAEEAPPSSLTPLSADTTAARAATTTAPPTTTSPPETTTTAAPKGRLVISGVGDTNLDPGYIPAFQAEGYEYAFSGLQDIFLDDDLTIVNLECAATTLGAPVKELFNFNCDIAALPIAREAGVEVANLANNHGADYGEEALLDTKANVEAAGIEPVGVGRTVAEATRPALFEINGWKIAVIGFGGVVPWPDWVATEDDAGMASGDDIELMARVVADAAQLADLVVVTVHWGVELDLQPRQEDIERANAMVEAGADIIFGHHPHRLQPLELIDGKPVAWSLGNFIWPRLSSAGSKTAIAQAIVAPDGTITACLIPVDIESSGHPVVQVDYRGNCEW
ncbi:MAG TPA: CapA family protein [Acidimicrobiia bacterium]|jgi:poly-gamma-glutamate synthesis protein (capsule biosynthesis protein)